MTEEIPRKIVFVILIVAIVLSLLGTWVTLDALNSKNEVYYLQPSTSGKVGFAIIKDVENSQTGVSSNG